MNIPYPCKLSWNASPGPATQYHQTEMHIYTHHVFCNSYMRTLRSLPTKNNIKKTENNAAFPPALGLALLTSICPFPFSFPWYLFFVFNFPAAQKVSFALSLSPISTLQIFETYASIFSSLSFVHLSIPIAIYPFCSNSNVHACIFDLIVCNATCTLHHPMLIIMLISKYTFKNHRDRAALAHTLVLAHSHASLTPMESNWIFENDRSNRLIILLCEWCVYFIFIHI